MPTTRPKEKARDRAKRRREEAEAAAAKTAEEEKSRTDRLAEIDAMLDDIEEVLEENAEDMVRQFVQKGGE
jgi:ubiquitin-like protein Pup